MASPASMSQAASEVKPRAFTLELTKGCNLRCGYCYYAQREEAYNPADRMSPEVAELSVETLLESGPPDQPLHLHFFGGEPLLNFPLLVHTVDYANRRAAEEGKRFTFEVTTNGTRLSREVIEFLDTHEIHVGVSFDGPPHVQDEARPLAGGSSYEAADEKIRQLLEGRRGTDLEAKSHCSVVVSRRELDLVRIVEHLEEMGFRKIILTPATDLTGEMAFGIRPEDLPRLLESYDRLAQDYERRLREGAHVSVTVFNSLMGRLTSGQRKEQFCDGGREYLGVAADGEVHLCYRFYENEEFSMGSVQEGIDRGVTQRLHDLPMEKKTDCSVCWARYYCGGGCHHDNLISGGDLGSPNPITCDIFRHNMSRVLEVWGRLSGVGAVSPIDPKTLESKSMNQEAGDRELRDDDRLAKSPTCHQRDLGGEEVVYHPETHEVVVLNRTASLILEHCDGVNSVGDLLGILKSRFDAPEAVLRRDLVGTLVDLRDKGILSGAEG